MKKSNFREWQKPQTKRNEAIYKLNLKDPAKWSWPVLAKKYGIRPERVGQIVKRQKELQVSCG